MGNPGHCPSPPKKNLEQVLLIEKAVKYTVVEQIEVIQVFLHSSSLFRCFPVK